MEVARGLAEEAGAGLVVGMPLLHGMPNASPRHWKFILEGIRLGESEGGRAGGRCFRVRLHQSCCDVVERCVFMCICVCVRESE